MSKLTLKDIIEAMDIVKEANTCKKCNTERCLLVLGYEGLYCKCEADKLCKTNICKRLQAFVNGLVQ